MKILFAILFFLVPAAASAATGVALDSKVFVERQALDPTGTPKIVLEEPKVVTPGDRLVFVLAYKNGGAAPAANFVVTNPIPKEVAFAGAENAGSVVSIDGGATWGPLETLKVTAPDGSVRSAGPADVTHVRWTLINAIPAGKGGQLSFRGVVK